MIFCAAGDPGGSKAILPIIDELVRRNIPCRVLAHGFLGKELPEQYEDMLFSPEVMVRHLASCAAYLFGSSTNDIVPLSLARKAKCMGKPVFHVLDNWSSYSARLTTDGKEFLVPDVYAVMDEAAAQGAAAEGVPLRCLVVTGHPGFAEIAPTLRVLLEGERQAAASRLGLPVDKWRIAFICEPFAEVFGSDTTRHGHPGFTEETVLSAFSSALAPYADQVYLALLPHPKQSEAAVEALWKQNKGSLQGRVVRLPQGRDILPAVNGVAGMASILLYEAWMAGLPVVAIQPDCRIPALKRFALFEGIAYTNSLKKTAQVVDLWLKKCAAQEQGQVRPELKTHEGAPAMIVDLLLQHARL